MSEQEFEVYLRLIAKLLQLSDAQREAISDELRDHMESRLDELMDQGMGRESAIHAAVEEFGDAAGLANQFTRITRTHALRRRIMKSSIGALAAAAAIALSFLYLLPQNRPGVSGPALSQAEEAEAYGGSPATLTITAGEPDPVMEKFSTPIETHFDNNRLINVFDYMANTTGVSIFVNWPALEKVGIDQDSPVTMALNETPATTVLTLILQSLNAGMSDPKPQPGGMDMGGYGGDFGGYGGGMGMMGYAPQRPKSLVDYAIVDGVVVISVREDIHQLREIRIYDCIDLIDPVGRAVTAKARTSSSRGAGRRRAGMEREVEVTNAGGRSARRGRSDSMTGMGGGGMAGGMGMDPYSMPGAQEGAGGMDPGGYGGDPRGFGGDFEMMAGPADAPTRMMNAGLSSTATREQRANELLQVVHILLEGGQAGTVSVYDHMLIVSAGNKTHERIQETFVLLRKAQAQRQ